MRAGRAAGPTLCTLGSQRQGALVARHPGDKPEPVWGHELGAGLTQEEALTALHSDVH